MNYDLEKHGFTVVENLYSYDEIASFEPYKFDDEFPFQDGDPKSAYLDFDFSKTVEIANSLRNKSFSIYLQKMYFKTAFESSYEMYHQDFFHRQNDGFANDNFLQVFIALEDLDHAPLNVFVGSHKRGLMPHTLGMERQGLGKYRIRNSVLREQADSFTPIKLKKGSAIFFDYLLIHGSASNCTPFDQPRAVVQLTENDLGNVIHGSDRRNFEIDILEKMLAKKKSV